MLKMAFFVKRAADVGHDDLCRHWLEAHAPGVRDHMGAQHYSVTHFKQRPDTAYDGLAELWYADPAVGRAVHKDPPPQVAGDGFVALTGPFVRLDCTEHVILDGPRPEGGIKMVYPVALAEGVDHDEARAYWLDVHAPLVKASMEATDGAHRYVVSQQNDPARGPYAGFAELWYDSLDAIREQGRILQPDDFGRFTVTQQPLRGTEYRVVS
jgi:hypothetical protein